MTEADKLIANIRRVHEANAARTSEAVWASVDEIHAQNAERLAAHTAAPADIPTVPSVGQGCRS